MTPARRIALALIAAGSWLAGPRQAEATESQLTATVQYQVLVNGVVEGRARVYSSDTPPLLLVVTSAIPRAVLFVPGEMVGHLVDAAQIKPTDRTSEVVTVGEMGTQTAPAAVVDGKLTFTIADKTVALQVAPPLTGSQSADTALSSIPGWRRNAEAYQPDLGAVEKLRKAGPMELTLVFGSWCNHCAHYAPRLLKAVQACRCDNVKLVLHGVPEQVASDPIWSEKQLTSLPTVLVVRGGQELGRIEGENQWEKPELALAAILAAPVPAAAAAPAAADRR